MNRKIKAFNINHRGVKVVEEISKNEGFKGNFDYGNISMIPRFRGTHPAVMSEWMSRFNWKDDLRYTGTRRSMNRIKSKHDRFKYMFISWIEKNLLFGTRMGEPRNYILLNR